MKRRTSQRTVLVIPPAILDDLRRVYPQWERLHTFVAAGAYTEAGRLLYYASLVQDAADRSARRDLSARWEMFLNEWELR